MSLYYSKQTGGFYHSDYHADHMIGENIPEDAIEITEDYHRELFEGQGQGKQIIADDNGYPILRDPVYTIEASQEIQKNILTGDYTNEITGPVKVKKNTFYTDPTSVQILQNYLQTGIVPDGFYWKSADKINVPFTIDDVKTL